MIIQLQRKLVKKNPTSVVIDCQGVGYFVNISFDTYTALPEGEAIKLYIYLQIKEDTHTLYGPLTRVECEMSVLPISVPGVRVGAVWTMLSSLIAAQARNATVNGKVVTIQPVKGIDVRIAQWAVLDLKDKMLKPQDFADAPISAISTYKEEALSALEVLGFVRKQAEKVVDKTVQVVPDSLSVEDVIKQALKGL